MTTTTAEAVTTTADTTSGAEPLEAAAPLAAGPTLPEPFVLDPGGNLAPEGTVIGSMPFEIEMNVSVAGMPPMTLGTGEGRIGRLVAGPVPDGDGAYREVVAYGPTLGEMARAAAEMIRGEILPGLAELADEADAADAADAARKVADEAAADGEAPPPAGCCQDRAGERAAATAEGLTIKCPDGSGPLASEAPVSDSPDGSAGE